MHMTPFGPYRACSPDEMRALLHGAAFPWWIAGGWAIDLFIGRQMREHDDLDIEVPHSAASAMRQHFAGWDMHAPHAALRDTAWPFVAWPADGPLPAGVDNVWCRPTPTAPWVFECMLASVADAQWHFRRDASITLPFASLIRHTANGMAYLTPEVQLLYKATSKQFRPKDGDDFDHALPLLGAEQRAWLGAALTALAPAHAWLAALGAGEG